MQNLLDGKYRIDERTGCWEWQAGRTSLGYGYVYDEAGRQRGAHRVAYESFVGPIPPGLNVNHKCHNRPCINPDHLYAGTQAENMQDAIQAGVHVSLFPELAGRKGAANANAKLSGQQVAEIRDRYATGERQVDLAAVFGVTQSQISQITRGVAWQ